MVARYPGLAAGPKIHRAAGPDRRHGAEHPGAVRGKALGRHRRPLLGEAGPFGRSRLAHQLFYKYNYEKQFPYTPNIRGVRTDQWKYIHYPHGDGSADRHLAELYDLQADPDERKNLVADPAQAPAHSPS